MSILLELAIALVKIVAGYLAAINLHQYIRKTYRENGGWANLVWVVLMLRVVFL